MAKRDKTGMQTARAVPLDQARVLKLFKERGKPLSIKEILSGLGAAKLYKAKLQHILEGLEASGRIIRIQGAFGLAESMRLITGRLEIQRSGVGYVLCDDQRRADVFINPRDFGDAWHGDRVAVALTRARGTRRLEGRIARVLERGTPVQPCRVERRLRPDLFLCRPTEPRLRHSLLLETSPGEEQPQIGDILNLTVGAKVDHQLWQGESPELLGREGDVAVQERLVKMNHAIPQTFPQAALDQAANLPPDPGPEDMAGREDLRGQPFVTIDGETARDFDDAICVERRGRGFLLRVAIADVAHCVPENSPLDLEARERGNSYYFPRSVEPMFPVALSNGLCSLNPHVPRLAMVVETDFSARGLPGASRFSPAVIQSQARLTYTQVHRALFLDDQAERKTIGHVLPMLEQAVRLAQALRERRAERGSLDFDLPEPEIHFNLSGETVDIRPRATNPAHGLIEECMIAANEAVASFLTERQAAFPYRVHPEADPGKLKALFDLLGRTELAPDLPGEHTLKDLQRLLAKTKDTDREYLVNRLVLRSMMQASYDVHNLGHYGLASECYCHFTSPIRRYADLMVHRALKDVLAGRRQRASAKRVQAVCGGLSRTERVAMEAEREILKRLTVLFLRDKVGQTFTGVVNSLSDFGFWVELTEVMAEGLVRLSTLTDDYYTLFPERQELLGQRTGRRIALGDTVRVELAEVNLGLLEVNLRLASEDRGPRKPSGQRQAGPPSPDRPRRSARRRPAARSRRSGV